MDLPLLMGRGVAEDVGVKYNSTVATCFEFPIQKKHSYRGFVCYLHLLCHSHAKYSLIELFSNIMNMYTFTDSAIILTPYSIDKLCSALIDILPIDKRVILKSLSLTKGVVLHSK